MWMKKYRLFDEVPADGTPAGGGSPTPEPQPVAPAVDEPVVHNDVDWEDLQSEVSDDSHWADEPAPTEPQTQQEPAQPQPVEPQQPVEPAADQQPIQPQPEAPVQQFTREQVAAAEQAYMAQLSQMYSASIDPDTALQLQTEPEKVLPQFAARLHLDVMKTVMAQVQAMVPNVVQTANRATVRESQAQDMFFGAWPELRGHDAQVMQVGMMYRQMNPTASPQEAVQRIGELTMVALGKQRVQPQQQPQTPQVQPFRPAGPGRAATPTPQPNLWEALIGDDD